IRNRPNNLHVIDRSRLSKAPGFCSLHMAAPQSLLCPPDLTGPMMDVIRAFPPLRNRRADAFRMLWRSGWDRHGAGAADDMPASSSAENPTSQVKLHVRGVSKTYGTSTVLKPL